jgi:hypothetical protein
MTGFVMASVGISCILAVALWNPRNYVTWRCLPICILMPITESYITCKDWGYLLVEEGSSHHSGPVLREVSCGFESTCNLNVFAGVVAWLDIVQIVGKWHNVIE